MMPSVARNPFEEALSLARRITQVEREIAEKQELLNYLMQRFRQLVPDKTFWVDAQIDPGEFNVSKALAAVEETPPAMPVLEVEVAEQPPHETHGDRIESFLNANLDEAFTHHAIAQALKMAPNSARQALEAMKGKRVRKVRRGYWASLNYKTEAERKQTENVTVTEIEKESEID